jgi:hypothetical protein
MQLHRLDKLEGRVNAHPNRGPHKQVFVCGVAERSGPVRQDISLYLLRCCVRTSRNLASQAG